MGCNRNKSINSYRAAGEVAERMRKVGEESLAKSRSANFTFKTAAPNRVRSHYLSAIKNLQGRRWRDTSYLSVLWILAKFQIQGAVHSGGPSHAEHSLLLLFPVCSCFVSCYPEPPRIPLSAALPHLLRQYQRRSCTADAFSA